MSIEITAAWTDCISTGANIVLAIAAICALITGSKTMKASQDASKAAEEANRQARLDSIAANRPYVFVEFLPSLAGVNCYDIRITNTGRSAAYNLTLQCSDWPEHEDDLVKHMKRFFETPQTLPPHASHRFYWLLDPKNERVLGHEESSAPASSMESPLGMGAKGTITVSYFDSPEPNSGRPYSDEYTFDLRIGPPLWPLPASPNLSTKSDAAKAITKVGKIIAWQLAEQNR